MSVRERIERIERATAAVPAAPAAKGPPIWELPEGVAWRARFCRQYADVMRAARAKGYGRISADRR
jgi:hypothetical protein